MRHGELGLAERCVVALAATTVQFPSTGTHTLRIQTREDGVQIDQIVLSPTTYLTVRPGLLTNDSTIVPKPAGAAPPVSTPYSGAPAAVPGTIEAENFDGRRRRGLS